MVEMRSHDSLETFERALAAVHPGVVDEDIQPTKAANGGRND